MNIYSEKLNQGASEVLEYFNRNKNKLCNEERRWLNLSNKMKSAAQLKDNLHAEEAINDIAHMVIDGFPITETFSQSYEEVLGAVQRAKKKRGNSHG